jgi:hypothetical protein
MALLPRPRTPNAHRGHRRAHSSALEICLTTADDEELIKDVQPLLDEKVLLVPGPKTQPQPVVLVVLWILSIATAVTCTYLWTTSRLSRTLPGGFATGFDTDLRTSKRHERLETANEPILQAMHAPRLVSMSNNSMEVWTSTDIMVSSH